jgi:hypothetical protein
MGRRHKRGDPAPLPFHVGQTSDDVVRVLKRSGRRCRRVDVTDDAGQVHTLTALRGRPRELDASAEAQGVKTKNLVEVVRYLDDCTLTFRYTRLFKHVPEEGMPLGRVVEAGPMCWRVSKIERIEETVEDGVAGD